ncbi:HBL090Cp [Eremothecium sinecaudum]|uniref:HBL090Cp n=1 Tax=Eremothecium sinecaudum TaxID=45286 RepID=A0A120K0Y3_9SACH|nr:HBL090Cp [Eremothecium sinecaudum]AMD18812.1 HBL090Cp [Eremothecium sinecaudum]
MAPLNIARLASITAATAVAALAGYAVYFDYQRRHSADFRKNLRRKIKKQKALEQAAQEQEKQAKLSHVGDFLTMELAKEPIPQDSSEKQDFFKSNIEEAELLSKLPGKELDSALKFYKALAVYPSPAELLGIYQRSIPESVYEYIVLMIALLPPANVSSFLSGSGSGSGTATAMSGSIPLSKGQPQVEAIGIDE